MSPRHFDLGCSREDPLAESFDFEDGFRVSFPVYATVDREVFDRSGLDAAAELLEDPAIGAFAPIFTTADSCDRTIRSRGLVGKRVVPLVTLEELWAVLMLLYMNGVAWIVVDPDDESQAGGRRYKLVHVLDHIRPPQDS
jgi:hypothetical protein